MAVGRKAFPKHRRAHIYIHESLYKIAKSYKNTSEFFRDAAKYYVQTKEFKKKFLANKKKASV